MRYQTGIRIELNEMFNCRTIEEARKIRDRIIDDYKDKASEAMECLDEGFEDSMTAMMLPYHLRKYYRTSNQMKTPSGFSPFWLRHHSEKPPY